MPDRSHAQAALGQQLYAVLEQCREPEILWAKLATGNYDWLGVRRNGEFVLGRPRLSPVVQEQPGPPPDDAREPHRIEALGPLQRVPRWEAHLTPEEPRDTFRRLVRGDPITPLRTSGVWRAAWSPTVGRSRSGSSSARSRGSSDPGDGGARHPGRPG